MSELDINMDDLLGLNESPFEANKADPFRVDSFRRKTCTAGVAFAHQIMHFRAEFVLLDTEHQLQILIPCVQAIQEIFVP